jgi:hypothetical protein
MGFLILNLAWSSLFAQATRLSFEGSPTEDTKEISASLTFDGDISIAEFRDAILDADHYPLTGRFGGILVLVECRLLDRRGNLYIIYQRTGGNLVVSPRQYVIGLSVAYETEDEIVIQWVGIKHELVDGVFRGPYAEALNQHASDHIYPLYKKGRWIYNRPNHRITYELETDSGGFLPEWAVQNGALLAYPRELLKEKWKIDGKLQ